MEPPISPLMQNQDDALKRLDFRRFWDPVQNLGKSSRFRAKLGSMTPTFFLDFASGD